MISNLVFLKNNEIDKVKWDSVLSKAQFSNYALKSYFLDAISPDWSALVYKDYEVVFPLTVRSKFGIKYLITPIFIPFLGFLSVDKNIQEAVVDHFFFEIYKQVKYLNLFLDPFTSSVVKKSEYAQRKCQVLKLDNAYELICKNYSVNHKRSIVKAKKSELVTNTSNDVNTLIQLFRDSKGGSLKELKASNFESLTFALQETLKNNDGFIVECKNEKELISSAFFAVCGSRITYVKGFSNEVGRKLGAMHFIIDQVVKQYSEADFVFDFGGSNNEQVAKFNYGFGAKDVFYCHLKQNYLPKLLKLFKS